MKAAMLCLALLLAVGEAKLPLGRSGRARVGPSGQASRRRHRGNLPCRPGRSFALRLALSQLGLDIWPIGLCWGLGEWAGSTTAM